MEVEKVGKVGPQVAQVEAQDDKWDIWCPLAVLHNGKIIRLIAIMDPVAMSATLVAMCYLNGGGYYGVALLFMVFRRSYSLWMGAKWGNYLKTWFWFLSNSIEVCYFVVAMLVLLVIPIYKMAPADWVRCIAFIIWRLFTITMVGLYTAVLKSDHFKTPPKHQVKMSVIHFLNDEIKDFIVGAATYWVAMGSFFPGLLPYITKEEAFSGWAAFLIFIEADCLFLIKIEVSDLRRVIRDRRNWLAWQNKKNLGFHAVALAKVVRVDKGQRLIIHKFNADATTKV